MRLRPVRFVRCGSLTVVLLAACSGAPPVVVAPKPAPTIATKPAAPKPASPSRWALRQAGPLSLEAKLDLHGGALEGATLYVGRGGARWLEKKGQSPVAAEVLLPDSLKGVARDESGKYLFAGASGSVFLTDDPLGPVVATRPASVPMRAASVGKSAIVGISESSVVRSADGGKSWIKVALPSTARGLPAQIAMLPTGEGLLLLAPQRVLVTADDGATFQELATPGIGARRVVADVNGELVLEGITAAARLARAPFRFEKMPHAPASGFEIPLPEGGENLLGAEAGGIGLGLFVGERWYELVADPEKADRFRLATMELGGARTTVLRPLSELEGCERVAIGGNASALIVGCTISNNAKTMAKWGPTSITRTTMKLFRSVDGGATFKEDGNLAAAEREKRIWLAPDGALIVDGACKKFPRESDCYESTPIVRLAGQKSAARVLSSAGGRFDRVVFDESGAHAYALGVDASGRLGVFASNDGGKGFARRALPSFRDEDVGSVQVQGEAGTIAVDEAGVVVAIVSGEGGRWLRYVSDDQGKSFKASLVDLDLDAVDLVGKRGLAYEITGKAWETADGGVTWLPVGAPEMVSTNPTDRLVSCGAYGCWVGDRAVRIGWDLPLGGAASAAKSATTPKKPVFGVPIHCVAQGPFQPLGDDPLPDGGNADLGGGTRWVTTRKNQEKGTLSALVSVPSTLGAKGGAKGVEIKDIVLFPPSKSLDIAQVAVMQVEGVAALRYAFKRDKSAQSSSWVAPKIPIKPGTKPPPPPPPPPKGGGIAPKQVVDVEIAWYVAATGKVHHATIKSAGAIDPTRDVIDGRERASFARYGLLSIADGGVHVRPFASASASDPLYFVATSGKVEKLTWPELPTRDARGRTLSPRIDAARVGGRSVVFGDVGPGLQIVLAAQMPGSGWESRAWGLWPELEGAPSLRFVDSGAKPALGTLWPGSAKLPPTGWAITIDPTKNDPEVIGSLPLQRELGDPPRACDATGALATYRVATPWSIGTRRPIVVQGDTEIVMASENVVVRTGLNGDHACARVIEGKSFGGSTNRYSALIPTDDPSHSSLFRARWNGGVTEITHQSMSCSYASDKGTLPASLATAPGFVE